MTHPQTWDAWTAAEEAELIRLRLAGHRLDSCALTLGRSYCACQVRYCALVREGRAPRLNGKKLARARGDRPPPAAPRKPRPGRSERNCMCCGTPFSSEGPHNRMCERCRRQGASPFDIPAVIRYR